MNNGRHSFSTLYRRDSGKERTMRTPVFAFLFTSRNGEATVQSMGNECIFDDPAVCGATFVSVFDAICWLRKCGFECNAAGSWQK